MGRGEFIDKNAHYPISAVCICICVYARHAGFVREVPKVSERDFGSRFIMLKNKLGKDAPIPKFIHLKIWRRDGVKSLRTLEEGEFKVPSDGCIKSSSSINGITLCVCIKHRLPPLPSQGITIIPQRPAQAARLVHSALKSLLCIHLRDSHGIISHREWLITQPSCQHYDSSRINRWIRWFSETP